MEINTDKMGCCAEKPVIRIYSGEKLCKNHFNEYFENKVFRTIRQFDLLDKEENIGVALSGGKDSLTVLSILNRLSKENPKIKISAIAIDEGIAGYRDRTLITAKEFCDKNAITMTAYSPLGRGAELKNPAVLEIAQKRGRSPAQVLINWLLGQNIAAIPRSKDPGHIEDNFKAVEWGLNEEDMAKLGKIGGKERVVNPPHAEFDE